MASLLLSFAGASLGGAILGPIGVVAGRLLGAVAGSVVDRALLGGKAKLHVEGPRLADLEVMGSTEGAPIPRVYGRARVAAEMIWATRLEEVVTTRSEQSGKGAALQPRVTTTSYSYFANFAVGLCAGPIARVGRIWADGKLIDASTLDHRVYLGHEDQLPDPLIEAKEGSGFAPAYRGLAYIVFERLALEPFGNRIPQVSVEVIRPVGKLEPMIRAVTLIPGSTEFGYAVNAVARDLGGSTFSSENRHVTGAGTDWSASLDELQALCPNLAEVALVVAWFGDDLRVGHCAVRPGVDSATKTTTGGTWQVGGLERDAAYVVSQHEGRAAYGGTPSDASVIVAIQDLKARGLKVTLYPFVMMDIPASNTLPDPWTGAAWQGAYPWRGRITCDPAPGRPGTPDATAAAATQVAHLFGTAAPADFSLDGERVVYSGPDEWTLRRMVLHYANLSVAAGGADAFLIGSEFEALTRVRSASGVYPAVSQLVSLAAAAKSVLGSSTKVSYAANWTERGAHVLAGGSEIRFPLDPLWAASAIDFVGVDYYAPLSDWRDSPEHLDAALTDTIYDAAYLRANLRGGEDFDFYYVDAAARRAQARSPITDGAYDKPWVHRAKDLWSWWSQPHYERVAGAELSTPTAWVPQAKPIRLTELGCPAVDKGSNQPNLFPDAKSAGAGYPHFSNRARDDLIQRRYHEAVIGKFDPAFGASVADNPVSSVYGGRMVESGIFLWTWDARPYPAFPFATEIWADGPNWETGHWLSGRLGAAPLDDLVAAVLADHVIDGADANGLRAAVDGYVLDRPMSARTALEPLALAFCFDAAADGDAIRFRPRGGKPVATIGDDALVADDKGPDLRLTRAQETELPLEITLGYTEISGDFRRSAVRSRRLVGLSRRQSRAELALVTNDAVAERAADIWLQDLWAGRERAEFSLTPSLLALTPGDVVTLDHRGRARLLEITELVDAEGRAVKARSIDPSIFAGAIRAPRSATVTVPPASGPPLVEVLDLPPLDADPEPVLQHFAARVSPWPSALNVWRANGPTSYQRLTRAEIPAIMGETLDPLPAGPVHRWDRANAFRVRLHGGVLHSQSDLGVLGGLNAAALKRADGACEVIQFADAELVDENTYLLSRLLRGQLGSEWAMSNPLPAGARFALLDRALVPVAKGLDLLGREFSYRVGPADADVGAASMTGLDATVTPTALLPFAPAHLRGNRTASGIAIAWIRRTRVNGDAWETLEVPLNEAAEAYRLEILDGANVVRTIETATPAALYASADELADFGAAQTSLEVRVAQLSALVGPGHFRAATLSL